MSELRVDKLDFDALMDEAEAEKTYGECPSCGEDHMLCPICGVCLKYCHDDYFHDDGMFDPYDPMHDLDD